MVAPYLYGSFYDPMSHVSKPKRHSLGNTIRYSTFMVLTVQNYKHLAHYYETACENWTSALCMYALGVYYGVLVSLYSSLDLISI